MAWTESFDTIYGAISNNVTKTIETKTIVYTFPPSC